MQPEQQQQQRQHPQQPDATATPTIKFAVMGVEGAELRGQLTTRQVAQSAEHSERAICDAFGQVSAR